MKESQIMTEMNKTDIVKEVGQIMHMNYAYDPIEDVGYASNGKLLLIIKFYNQYYRIFDYKTKTSGFLQISYNTTADALREKLTTAVFNEPMTILNTSNVEESNIFHTLSRQKFFDFTLHDNVGFVLTWTENPTFNFLIRMVGEDAIILTLKAYGYKSMTTEQKSVIEQALTDILCPKE